MQLVRAHAREVPNGGRCKLPGVQNAAARLLASSPAHHLQITGPRRHEATLQPIPSHPHAEARHAKRPPDARRPTAPARPATSAPLHNRGASRTFPRSHGREQRSHHGSAGDATCGKVAPIETSRHRGKCGATPLIKPLGKINFPKGTSPPFRDLTSGIPRRARTLCYLFCLCRFAALAHSPPPVTPQVRLRLRILRRTSLLPP